MSLRQTALIVSFLVTNLVASGCAKISSEEVDASSIYGEIAVNREESSSSVEVDASFYVGGSTGTMVYLVSPAGVRINGSPAAEVNDPILGRVHYTMDISASASSATVSYTDKNGRVYTNVVPIPGLLYANAPGTVPKSSGFSVSYTSSSAFAAGERVEVVLSGSDARGGGSAGNTRTEYAMAGTGSGAIAVSSYDLQSFAPGSIRLEICRRRTPAAQHPYPKGLYVTAKSCANPVTVNLVE